MQGKTKMTFPEFCERLKEDGATQHDDGHIYRADGRILSRQCRNGYYLLRKMYDGITYHFMEHRVAWFFENGDIPDDMQINHKDFNRTNNRIENLELMTAKENINYTKDAGRAKYCLGSDSPRAAFSDDEVKLIRYLKKNGWDTSKINEMFDNSTTNTTLVRVINGSRYGNVLDADSVMAIYPLIVNKTCRKDLPQDEQIKNCLLGIACESGELIDMEKKAFYHGHELDLIHAQLEIGDILYYLCWLCMIVGIDFSEVMFANMEKLNARYPEGFDANLSKNRKEGDI